MMILIGAALAVGAVLIGWLSRMSATVSRVLDGLAVTAIFLFFVTAADAIAQTLMDDTVFMTEVHRVLKNMVFLISGAYLGPYALARIALQPFALLSRK